MAAPDLDEKLFGSVVLPNDIELGCMVYFIRGDADADWLDLSIPMWSPTSDLPPADAEKGLREKFLNTKQFHEAHCQDCRGK